jgi:hypothetical protein
LCAVVNLKKIRDNGVKKSTVLLSQLAVHSNHQTINIPSQTPQKAPKTVQKQCKNSANGR